MTKARNLVREPREAGARNEHAQFSPLAPQRADPAYYLANRIVEVAMGARAASASNPPPSVEPAATRALPAARSRRRDRCRALASATDDALNSLARACSPAICGHACHIWAGFATEVKAAPDIPTGHWMRGTVTPGGNECLVALTGETDEARQAQAVVTLASASPAHAAWAATATSATTPAAASSATTTSTTNIGPATTASASAISVSGSGRGGATTRVIDGTSPPPRPS